MTSSSQNEETGERMVRRPETSCGTECTSCTGDRYSDSYNVDMTCNSCTNCNKPNMKLLSRCNTTHNAVCTCTAGYKCKDQPCTQCEAISTPTKPTLTPSTSSYFLTQKPAPESQFFEHEEVSKPVQEVCGKCDQLIAV
ncbi:CD27 antigen CD27L receptor T-cell activation antigen CD27 [Channa argus]|nr:CD27 antigen CD27L receptor T-cell activation antigen CD27 [Channa argus]